MKEFIRIVIFIIYILALFGFKKIVLNRIKNRSLRYVLGMAFACLLYLCFLELSVECEFLRWTHDEILSHVHNPGKGRDGEVIWIFVPTVYSLILLGKSEKRVPKHSKEEAGGLGKLIAFILLNFFFTLFIGLIFNYCLAGGKLRELFIIMGDSFKDVEWKYIVLFLIGILIFYFLIKGEARKDDIDDIKRELNDMSSIKKDDNSKK